MATPVTMPQLGYDMTEGAIQNWLKKEGEKVNKGDIIAEVETDKSTIEMEAFTGGVIRKIVVQPGQTVPVGTVIAVIGEENEEIDWKALGVDAPSGGAAAPKPAAAAAPAPQAAASAPKPAATPAPAPAVAQAPAASSAKAAPRKPLGTGLINLAAPQGATGGPGGAPVASEIAAAGINAPGKGEGDEAAAQKQVVSSPTPQTPAAAAPTPQLPTPAPVAVSGTVIAAGAEGRVKSSPLARKVARDLGVDLAEVNGTGPNGRVIRADVEGFAGSAKATSNGATTAVAAQPQAETEPVAAAQPHAGADYEDITLSRMRQTIARRLTESKQQIPHFYVSCDVNMTEALKLRQQVNGSLAESGVKVSVNDLVIKASAKALRKFPVVNSGWVDGKVRRFNRVNVSMAVALEEGLITPVIFDADQKAISQIAVEAKALAEKARAGKLRPEEFQGGTFSISNLGMYDVTSFVAVINPPQAAILAVASTKPVVVLKSGSPEEGTAEFGVEQRMTVTISADHRVADGAVAAQFLQEFKRVLENPLLLLV